MIHYGKTPHGDLEIRLSADNVGEVYDMIRFSGRPAVRETDELLEYIEKEFSDELAQHRRRMTAQIPRKEVRDAAV